mgnify:CR=1 FL=1
MRKLTAVICAFAMLVTSFGIVGLTAYADDTTEATQTSQASETREEVDTGVLDTLIFGDAESEAAHSFTESMTAAGVDDTKEAQYTAEDLVSSRSLMASQIEEVLSKKLAAYNIELVGASIENMDFTDAFTDAVEAKQVAEQNKLRAETEAQQRVLEANAAAEIKRIEAEADAYELTTRAEAEAEANRKIAESLTEALIAYTYAENWNGELPTFMTGDGTTLPMFDMSALLNGTADNGTTAAQPAE